MPETVTNRKLNENLLARTHLRQVFQTALPLDPCFIIFESGLEYEGKVHQLLQVYRQVSVPETQNQAFYLA